MNSLQPQINKIKCSKNKQLYLDYFKFLNVQNATGSFINFKDVNTKYVELFSSLPFQQNIGLFMSPLISFLDSNKLLLSDFINLIGGDCDDNKCKTDTNSTIETYIDCICKNDKAIIELYIDFFKKMQTKQPHETSNDIYKSNQKYTSLDHDICIKLSVKISPDHPTADYAKILSKLKECSKTVPVSVPVPVPVPVSVKAISSDSITYVTPQAVVYVHNKNNPNIIEYQGSLENEENSLREVKLNEKDEIEINGTSLKYDNFKDLYPFITTFEEFQTDPTQFFNDMYAASKWVLKDIAKNK